jgi:hypothetical protein
MCICFYSGLSCDVRDCFCVLCIICLFNKGKKWQQTCFCCWFSTNLEFYCHADDSFIKRLHFQCWFLSRFKKKSLKSMLHFGPHCSFRVVLFTNVPGVLFREICNSVFMCTSLFSRFFSPSYTLLGFSVISVKHDRCQAMNKVTAW